MTLLSKTQCGIEMYLKFSHISHKASGTEDDLDIDCAVGRHNPLARLDHKCSIGLQHADLIFKVDGHIAGQADVLGIRFSHSTLAKADASRELGLIHHGVGVDRNEHVRTL